MTKTKRDVPCSASIQAAISDAFAAIQTLGEECRESYDNMPENLQGADYAQGLSDAADAIEYLEEPELPDWLGDDSYYTAWNEDQRKGLSRAVRLNNAVAALDGARDSIETIGDSIEDELQELQKSGNPESDETQAKIKALEAKREELEEVSNALQSLIDEAQNIEFPTR